MRVEAGRPPSEIIVVVVVVVVVEYFIFLYIYIIVVQVIRPTTVKPQRELDFFKSPDYSLEKS